ncbi:MAG TPA: alpha-D-glucose phosphate-specific phosphoglucomutase, partial [Stellaceae bacterium]|nr:alpha-D-glucose phosphate-specific phosphoglucomutase [Stellaceae bacterium]
MDVLSVPVSPFPGQRPGTSGLRKKVAVFREPGYLEAFVQAIFDALPEAVGRGVAGETLVLGGDGRFFNDRALQTIVRLAAGNGVGRLIVGRGGLLSTPAASALIRERGAFGGIVLSASHNPGGPDGDFGIKYNVANGGPAPERVTEAIYRRAERIAAYRTVEAADLPLDRLGTNRLLGTEIAVVDPVADYAALMERIFDFDRLRALFRSGFGLRFDAMSAVTGPYAREIFERRLGAGAGSAIHAEPLPDFGGHHPDPNPTYAASLVAALAAADAPDFGAASDGDGDRNMVVTRAGPV